ncbi:endonuclease/exonuclease/phosphatase family protein [Acuticoccus yangtzensis]|uniref:endonuclease/exonuclease/phosphatase family protein n=1 Tax=Acuticoccus yangtzensis TaxID=1443441 RepID=UPI0009496925|nr:endonuclease/exonuclease/phosphatase family protein [Acuticoccus yangtzensis]
MRFLIRLWRWGFDLGALLGGLAIALGFLGALHPAFDSLSHFRAHLAVVTAVLALVRLLSGPGIGRIMAAVILVGSVIAGAMTARYMIADTSLHEVRGETHTLLQFNTRIRLSEAIDLINKANPDFAVLQEMPRRLFEQEAERDPRFAAYPYYATCDADSLRASGLVILSKLPFVDPPVCSGRANFMRAAVIIGNDVLTIGAHHLDWPWPFGQWTGSFAELATLRATGGAAILAGDFNAAPWSTTVQRYASLTRTLPTTGIGPTWLLDAVNPAWRPYVGLPIDNILTSGIAIAQVERIEGPGSDHLAVMIRFAIEDY